MEHEEPKDLQTHRHIHDQLEKPKALLIATYHGASQKIICDEHLQELELLAETYGVETVQKVAAPLLKVEASTYIG